MTEASNRIKDILLELKICSEKSIYEFFPKVRNRDDISVLKCRDSGVIFLSRSDHISPEKYEEIGQFEYWSSKGRREAINKGLQDTERRKILLKDYVKNKHWVDIGTGTGILLEELKDVAELAAGVEPQVDCRNYLNEVGIRTYKSSIQLPNDSFDVASLFHVFEHFTDPLAELKEINKKIKKRRAHIY